MKRRTLLTAIPGFAMAPFLFSCAGGHIKGKLKKKVNKKAHWARRQEWSGKEMVFGVAGIGDRYLLVKNRYGEWDFPGGTVYSDVHGEKSETNDDLVNSAGYYVNSQALISLRFQDLVLFAYGFAINQNTWENTLVHWFSVAMPNSMPTKPHPNMKDTIDARWVTLDDPVIGKCLQMRTSEYQEADEGSSFLKQSCLEYSI